jgi:hypothetical protein
MALGEIGDSSDVPLLREWGLRCADYIPCAAYSIGVAGGEDELAGFIASLPGKPSKQWSLDMLEMVRARRTAKVRGEPPPEGEIGSFGLPRKVTYTY